MDVLLLVLVVLFSAAATGLFLWAVWRFVFMPSLARLDYVRRAVVVVAVLTPAVVPIAIALLLDLSDRQAFVVIAATTFVALGTAIAVSLKGQQAQDKPHD